jgi:hypothetical protein
MWLSKGGLSFLVNRTLTSQQPLFVWQSMPKTSYFQKSKNTRKNSKKLTSTQK